MAGGVPSPEFAPTAAWAAPSGSSSQPDPAARYSASPIESAADPVSPGPGAPRTSGWQAALGCPRCGSAIDARSAYCASCGFPLFYGGHPLCYASFWRRVAACLIDLVLIALAEEVFSYVVPSESWLAGNLWLTIWFFYYSLLESSRWRATLGKRSVGIAVCGSDGRRLTLPRAAIRTLAKILSVAICGVGLVMPLLTARKQALHDVLTDAVVVRK